MVPERMLQDWRRGTYTVTITDANDVLPVDRQNVTEPSAIVIQSSTTQQHAVHQTNRFFVVVNGGSSPYSYSWSPSGSSSGMQII